MGSLRWFFSGIQKPQQPVALACLGPQGTLSLNSCCTLEVKTQFSPFLPGAPILMSRERLMPPSLKEVPRQSWVTCYSQPPCSQPFLLP